MRRLLWTTAELRTQGFSKAAIAGMVDTDRLRPVRRGVWAETDAPDELVRVARLGGVATATTGARALELWTPDDEVLHAAVPPGATRLHDPDDGRRPLVPDPRVQVHWSGRVRAAHTYPDRIAPLLGSMLPAHLHGIVRYADARADSGLETIVRHLLVVAGMLVEVHPVLPGIGEVDLLIGGRLIIETAGREYHLGDAFAKDRQRDRTATIDGDRVLRLSYRQVVHEWPDTFRAICAALALA